MKEDINLLPPSALFAQTRQLYWRQAQRLVLLVIGWLVLGLAIMGVSWYLALENMRTNGVNMNDAVDTSSLVTEEVREANQVLRVAQNWMNGWSSVVDRVPAIVEAVPAGVEISSISFSEEDNALMVKGSSNAREKVLEYQEKLQLLEFVDKVEAPLSNFASGVKISFSFTIWLEK